jgi:hypothetical protein
MSIDRYLLVAKATQCRNPRLDVLSGGGGSSRRRNHVCQTHSPHISPFRSPTRTTHTRLPRYSPPMTVMTSLPCTSSKKEKASPTSYPSNRPNSGRRTPSPRSARRFPTPTPKRLTDETWWRLSPTSWPTLTPAPSRSARGVGAVSPSSCPATRRSNWSRTLTDQSSRSRRGYQMTNNGTRTATVGLMRGE